MKKTKHWCYILVLLAIVIIAGCASAKQVKGPSQKISSRQVLQSLRLTNRYFMDKWPDTGKPIYTNRWRPSNIWTRAVYYEGLMALYQIDPDQSYYNYAVDWGNKHKWGMRNGVETRNADDQACGQTYLDLYDIDPQPQRIKDIKDNIDFIIQSGKVDDWTWIDAIQMGMPVFAKLGVMNNDKTYLSICIKCTTIQKLLRVEGCIIRPINYGGETKILFHPIRSLMDKIVIGQEGMVGW
ncbi:glycoside hydrolase family 88 protein [Sphingobacterium sp. KU25419]|nr:glycoside hydrolase family 88 protein [Sphingobacterium sp. KU25419]